MTAARNERAVGLQRQGDAGPATTATFGPTGLDQRYLDQPMAPLGPSSLEDSGGADDGGPRLGAVAGGAPGAA